MSRKDDIPDISYLRVRFRYYEAIAQAFGFVELDGTRPISENADRVTALVRQESEKLYVHYVHANNADVGGADLMLVAMAAHMRAPVVGPSHRVSVSLRLATSAARAHANNGTPVLLARFVRPQLSGGPLGIAKFAAAAPLAVYKFRRVFRRERPDIVHVNDLYDFLPAVAARSLGIPVVYHLRMIKTGSVGRAFAWLIPRLSTRSIAVSQSVRNAYFPYAKQDDRALVIHDLGNPLLIAEHGDTSIAGARPAELEGDGLLVVMVGRLEQWKGQHVFLDAIARLSADLRAKHVFALVGGGVPGKESYARETIAAATDLGVRCLGVRDDVPAILRAADVSVHCSIEPDPFPGVVIESLLAGAATVGADAGGVPEMIADETIGLLHQPGDVDALAEVITRLLTSQPSPRAFYGPAGRARALAITDPAVIDRRMSQAYGECAPGFAPTDVGGSVQSMTEENSR